MFLRNIGISDGGGGGGGGGHGGAVRGVGGFCCTRRERERGSPLEGEEGGEKLAIIFISLAEKER